jgi:hypothetical protein
VRLFCSAELFSAGRWRPVVKIFVEMKNATRRAGRGLLGIEGRH